MAIPYLAPQGQRNQSPPLWGGCPSAHTGAGEVTLRAATFPKGEGLGRVKTLPYKVTVIAGGKGGCGAYRKREYPVWLPDTPVFFVYFQSPSGYLPSSVMDRIAASTRGLSAA